MSDCLVCAIDGENVSFAIPADAGGPRLADVRRFKTSEFPTFTDALQSYARSMAITTDGLNFGLAVAGISKGDVITFANCRWYVSVSGLKAFLRQDPFIINDFAATAWSLTCLDEAATTRIGPLPAKRVPEGGRFVVVGTGVGLGIATIAVRRDGSVGAFESEGGHSSFSPQTLTEDALLAGLRKKFGHVSFERVLSHHGLEHIYAWLAEQEGKSRPATAAHAILANAARRHDPLALDAAALFADVLGSFVGNAVLSASAWDGVFLTGEMVGTLLPVLEQSNFRNRMNGKGRMARALEKVPVSFIRDKDACLSGTAVALRKRRPN